MLLSRAVHALEHHPKHVTALLAALMLGGGGGAFAVASLDPEPSTVVVRQVLESVTPLPVQDQIEVLDVHSFKLFRSETTRASDTAEALLARLGVDDPRAASFLRTDPMFRAQVLGHAGRTVTVEASDSHALDKLSARWAPDDDGTFKRLVIERTPQGRFASRVETAAAGRRHPHGQRHRAHFAVRRRRRGTHPRWRGRQDRRDLFQRHRFPPLAATRRPLQRGVRGPGGGRRSHAHGPRPLGRIRQQGQAAPGHVVRGAGPQGRLLHAGRQEPGHFVPGLADGVLARDQRLREALPSGPAQLESPLGRRLRAPRPARRCVPWAMVSSSSRASRTASARW